MKVTRPATVISGIVLSVNIGPLSLAILNWILERYSRIIDFLLMIKSCLIIRVYFDALCQSKHVPYNKDYPR